MKTPETRTVTFRLAELQRFVDVVPDPAVICQDNGRVVCANDGARALFRSDGLGKDVHDLREFVPALRRTTEAVEFVDAVRAGELDKDLTVVRTQGTDLEVWFSTSRVRELMGNIYLVLVTMRDVSERKAHQEMLRRMSTTDELTQIHNRRYLRMNGELERQRAVRYGLKLVCIFIDLDEFKAVNDRFGHRVGDRALVAVARMLGERVRQVDLLCRYGGDEFVVLGLVPDVDGARRFAERLGESPPEVETLTGERIPVRMSCGAVCVDSPEQIAVDELVDLADKEMRAAKEAGRSRHFFREYGR
jgi:diguanylate cyclase (GGDEF)-like protein